MICTARPAGRHESLLLCFCSSVQIKPVYICICVLVKQQTPTCVATQFLLCECEWGRDAAPLPPGLSVKVRVVPVWGGNPASVYKSVYTHTHTRASWDRGYLFTAADVEKSRWERPYSVQLSPRCCPRWRHPLRDWKCFVFRVSVFWEGCNTHVKHKINICFCAVHHYYVFVS